MVPEALSQEFRTGCPWELLYADDLINITELAAEFCQKSRVIRSNKSCLVV